MEYLSVICFILIFINGHLFSAIAESEYNQQNQFNENFNERLSNPVKRQLTYQQSPGHTFDDLSFIEQDLSQYSNSFWQKYVNILPTNFYEQLPPNIYQQPSFDPYDINTLLQSQGENLPPIVIKPKVTENTFTEFNKCSLDDVIRLADSFPYSDLVNDQFVSSSPSICENEQQESEYDKNLLKSVMKIVDYVKKQQDSPAVKQKYKGKKKVKSKVVTPIKDDCEEKILNDLYSTMPLNSEINMNENCGNNFDEGIEILDQPIVSISPQECDIPSEILNRPEQQIDPLCEIINEVVDNGLPEPMVEVPVSDDRDCEEPLIPLTNPEPKSSPPSNAPKVLIEKLVYVNGRSPTQPSKDAGSHPQLELATGKLYNSIAKILDYIQEQKEQCDQNSPSRSKGGSTGNGNNGGGGSGSGGLLGEVVDTVDDTLENVQDILGTLVGSGGSGTSGGQACGKGSGNSGNAGGVLGGNGGLLGEVVNTVDDALENVQDILGSLVGSGGAGTPGGQGGAKCAEGAGNSGNAGGGANGNGGLLGEVVGTVDDAVENVQGILGSLVGSGGSGSPGGQGGGKCGIGANNAGSAGGGLGGGGGLLVEVVDTVDDALENVQDILGSLVGSGGGGSPGEQPGGKCANAISNSGNAGGVASGSGGLLGEVVDTVDDAVENVQGILGSLGGSGGSGSPGGQGVGKCGKGSSNGGSAGGILGGNGGLLGEVVDTVDDALENVQDILGSLVGSGGGGSPGGQPGGNAVGNSGSAGGILGGNDGLLGEVVDAVDDALENVQDILGSLVGSGGGGSPGGQPGGEGAGNSGSAGGILGGNGSLLGEVVDTVDDALENVQDILGSLIGSGGGGSPGGQPGGKAVGNSGSAGGILGGNGGLLGEVVDTVDDALENVQDILGSLVGSGGGGSSGGEAAGKGTGNRGSAGEVLGGNGGLLGEVVDTVDDALENVQDILGSLVGSGGGGSPGGQPGGEGAGNSGSVGGVLGGNGGLLGEVGGLVGGTSGVLGQVVNTVDDALENVQDILGELVGSSGGDAGGGEKGSSNSDNTGGVLGGIGGLTGGVGGVAGITGGITGGAGGSAGGSGGLTGGVGGEAGIAGGITGETGGLTGGVGGAAGIAGGITGGAGGLTGGVEGVAGIGGGITGGAGGSAGGSGGLTGGVGGVAGIAGGITGGAGGLTGGVGGIVGITGGITGGAGGPTGGVGGAAGIAGGITGEAGGLAGGSGGLTGGVGGLAGGAGGITGEAGGLTGGVGGVAGIAGGVTGGAGGLAGGSGGLAGGVGGVAGLAGGITGGAGGLAGGAGGLTGGVGGVAGIAGSITGGAGGLAGGAGGLTGGVGGVAGIAGGLTGGAGGLTGGVGGVAGIAGGIAGGAGGLTGGVGGVAGIAGGITGGAGGLTGGAGGLTGGLGGLTGGGGVVNTVSNLLDSGTPADNLVGSASSPVLIFARPVTAYIPFHFHQLQDDMMASASSPVSTIAEPPPFGLENAEGPIPEVLPGSSMLPSETSAMQGLGTADGPSSMDSSSPFSSLTDFSKVIEPSKMQDSLDDLEGSDALELLTDLHEDGPVEEFNNSPELLPDGNRAEELPAEDSETDPAEALIPADVDYTQAANKPAFADVSEISGNLSFEDLPTSKINDGPLSSFFEAADSFHEHKIPEDLPVPNTEVLEDFRNHEIIDDSVIPQAPEIPQAAEKVNKPSIMEPESPASFPNPEIPIYPYWFMHDSPENHHNHKTAEAFANQHNPDVPDHSDILTSEMPKEDKVLEAPFDDHNGVPEAVGNFQNPDISAYSEAPGTILDSYMPMPEAENFENPEIPVDSDFAPEEVTKDCPNEETPIDPDMPSDPLHGMPLDTHMDEFPGDVPIAPMFEDPSVDSLIPPNPIERPVPAIPPPSNIQQAMINPENFQQQLPAFEEVPGKLKDELSPAESRIYSKKVPYSDKNWIHNKETKQESQECIKKYLKTFSKEPKFLRGQERVGSEESAEIVDADVSAEYFDSEEDIKESGSSEGNDSCTSIDENEPKENSKEKLPFEVFKTANSEAVSRVDVDNQGPSSTLTDSNNKSAQAAGSTAETISQMEPPLPDPIATVDQPNSSQLKSPVTSTTIASKQAVGGDGTSLTSSGDPTNLDLDAESSSLTSPYLAQSLPGYIFGNHVPVSVAIQPCNVAPTSYPTYDIPPCIESTPTIQAPVMFNNPICPIGNQGNIVQQSTNNHQLIEPEYVSPVEHFSECGQEFADITEVFQDMINGEITAALNDEPCNGVSETVHSPVIGDRAHESTVVVSSGGVVNGHDFERSSDGRVYGPAVSQDAMIDKILKSEDQQYQRSRAALFNDVGPSHPINSHVGQYVPNEQIVQSSALHIAPQSAPNYKSDCQIEKVLINERNHEPGIFFRGPQFSTNFNEDHSGLESVPSECQFGEPVKHNHDRFYEEKSYVPYTISQNVGQAESVYTSRTEKNQGHQYFVDQRYESGILHPAELIASSPSEVSSKYSELSASNHERISTPDTLAQQSYSGTGGTDGPHYYVENLPQNQIIGKPQDQSEVYVPKQKQEVVVNKYYPQKSYDHGMVPQPAVSQDQDTCEQYDVNGHYNKHNNQPALIASSYGENVVGQQYDEQSRAQESFAYNQGGEAVQYNQHEDQPIVLSQPPFGQGGEVVQYEQHENQPIILPPPSYGRGGEVAKYDHHEDQQVILSPTSHGQAGEAVQYVQHDHQPIVVASRSYDHGGEAIQYDQHENQPLVLAPPSYAQGGEVVQYDHQEDQQVILPHTSHGQAGEAVQFVQHDDQPIVVAPRLYDHGGEATQYGHKNSPIVLGPHSQNHGEELVQHDHEQVVLAPPYNQHIEAVHYNQHDDQPIVLAKSQYGQNAVVGQYDQHEDHQVVFPPTSHVQPGEAVQYVQHEDQPIMLPPHPYSQAGKTVEYDQHEDHPIVLAPHGHYNHPVQMDPMYAAGSEISETIVSKGESKTNAKLPLPYLALPNQKPIHSEAEVKLPAKALWEAFMAGFSHRHFLSNIAKKNPGLAATTQQSNSESKLDFANIETNELRRDRRDLPLFIKRHSPKVIPSHVIFRRDTDDDRIIYYETRKDSDEGVGETDTTGSDDNSAQEEYNEGPSETPSADVRSPCASTKYVRYYRCLDCSPDVETETINIEPILERAGDGSIVDAVDPDNVEPTVIGQWVENSEECNKYYEETYKSFVENPPDFVENLDG